MIIDDREKMYTDPIIFPKANTPLKCPVCGYSAKISRTVPDRSSATIDCENCLRYCITSNALVGVPDLYLFSGYLLRHQPDHMTIMCHSNDSVKKAVEEISNHMNREFQLFALVEYYYLQMDDYGSFMSMGKMPSIAYAKDENELSDIVMDGSRRGFIKYESGMITVTPEGKKFMDEYRDSQRESKEKPSVFISYNWDSSELVDKIEERLKPYALVCRDKNMIEWWESIKGYMDTIRDRTFAILVISDKYLKSENCLYEAVQLMKNKDWHEKTMFFVEEDACSIYSPVNQISYVKYWEDKENDLRKKIEECNPANVSKQMETLHKVSMVTKQIGEFVFDVADANNPKMDTAIEMAIQRVKGKVEWS